MTQSSRYFASKKWGGLERRANGIVALWLFYEMFNYNNNLGGTFWSGIQVVQLFWICERYVAVSRDDALKTKVYWRLLTWTEEGMLTV
jgi:hypothetical protein